MIAQDYLNGHDTLLDDDVDRVYGYKIDVNRWQRCDHSLLCIEDKYTGKSIICSGTTEVRKTISLLNKMDLEREKAEAKIRAMTL